jgi:hypothetical protein
MLYLTDSDVCSAGRTEEQETDFNQQYSFLLLPRRICCMGLSERWAPKTLKTFGVEFENLCFVYHGIRFTVF